MLSMHRMIEAENHPAEATCSCGWRVVGCTSAASAVERFTIHARERRAADCTARAVECQRSTMQRSAELVVQRITTQARRAALTVQRQAIEDRMTRARAVRSLGRVHLLLPADGQELDHARELAGLPTEQLWIDYFALGGMLTFDALVTALAGTRRLSVREHDLLACALNERFSESGFGQPVDYAYDRVAAQRAARAA